MKNMKVVYGVLGVLLLLTGIVVLKAVTRPKVVAPVVEEDLVVDLPQVDASVTVDLVKGAKANTVVLEVSGLASKYKGIGYEFTYDSKDVIKGVNSGNSPIDVSGKDAFSKEVYLGTCSRNVCTPDPGVTAVSVILTFTATDDQKSQFSKDFEL